MLAELTCSLKSVYAPDDYLRKADEIEALCEAKTEPRLFARREKIAAKLREMAADPGAAAHEDALAALALVDYAAW